MGRKRPFLIPNRQRAFRQGVTTYIIVGRGYPPGTTTISPSRLQSPTHFTHFTPLTAHHGLVTVLATYTNNDIHDPPRPLIAQERAMAALEIDDDGATAAAHAHARCVATGAAMSRVHATYVFATSGCASAATKCTAALTVARLCGTTPFRSAGTMGT